MRLDYLADLNPEQREAALCRDHCMVIALPGAGKTKTLAAKAAFVLSDGQSRVAAVTFTRDAAVELRDRIVKIAGAGVLPRIVVGTYHSVDLLMAFPDRSKPGRMGSEILNGRVSPFKKKWVIAAEGHRRSYIARALQESGLGVDFEDAARIIEESKTNPQLADSPEKKQLVSTYQSLMARHEEIDFQDIILLTNAALANGSLAPLAVDMLFLDEYQDTDLKQYEWAAAHGRVGVKITAVGDDDQSIYAFRKALGYAGVELFRSQFAARTIVLGTNYRSHEEILASATLVVRNNVERVEKIAVAHKGYGGIAEWEGFADRECEADACALAAKAAHSEGKSFAVLTRTNARLEQVESRLIVRQVPYRRNEGESILDYRESALFSALVESVYKPSPKTTDEVMAWSRVSERDVAKLHAMVGGMIQRLHPTEMIEQGIDETSRSTWNRFAKLHGEWKEQINANHAGTSFLVRRGILTYLSEFATDKRSLSRLETISGIFECGEKSTLLDRLNLLRTAQKNQKKENVGQGTVQLMTAHGSKGLEFDHVWIAGAEEEVFPNKDASTEEERRLFYVAMTRARYRLTISKSGVKKPSRFIMEGAIPRAALGKYKTRKEDRGDEAEPASAEAPQQAG